VLGGGSNVVIADGGFPGLVVSIGLLGIEAATDDSGEVEVAAGEPWHDFVMAQVRRGLQGIECLAGIPGLVGATPLQNVGAYGQEVSETIVRVEAFDVERGIWRSFDNAELRFAYRDSFFKSEAPNSFIVTKVRFRLRPGAAPALRYAELEQAAERLLKQDGRQSLDLGQTSALVMSLRRSKSMLHDVADENGRSCGSFFVNPRVPREVLDRIQTTRPGSQVPHYAQPDGSVKLPAAWLIEQAGLPKGTQRGSVGLSTRHSLALVAHAGATAAAVLSFAHEVRAEVARAFGVELVPEPVFWGFSESDRGLPPLDSAGKAE
jgi:UDP-N-acetylmuramate dehydrogenase